MSIEKIEYIFIECLKKNLELSEGEIPPINKNTKLACDLSNFDSLRTVEVLILVGEKLGCELPAHKVFSEIKFEDADVSTIAAAIDKVRKKTKK